MNRIVFDTLTIERIDSSPERMEIWFRGQVTMKVLDFPIMGFFEQILTEAQQRECTLNLHFADVDACRSRFLSHINSFVQDAIDKQVRAALYFDSSQAWQEKHMDFLKRLVDKSSHVTINVETREVRHGA